MSTTDRSQTFADALQAYEKGDQEALLSQFGDGVQLQRPERKHGPGVAADAETFWQQYISEFDHIATEFTRIVEVEDEAVLEWRSTGQLAAGRDIDYAGVSLLTFDGDTVSRFATYYDTASFVDPIE